MSTKLKIAIYSGDIPSTTFIERLIKGLSHTGVQIYLFGFLKTTVTYNSSVKVIGYKNTKIFKLLHLIKYSILLLCFRTKEKAKLDSLLKQKKKTNLNDKVKYYPVLWHKPDIFHIQWAKSLEDWDWVQVFGIPLVVSLRGAHINYSPIADIELAKTYRKLFPKVDAFHAVSKAIGKEAQIYGAPIERITTIYSGLDLYSTRLAITNTENGVFKIVSVGRPHWKKGYTYALDACKLLKDAGFSFKYVIVGGAEPIEYLYQIHDLGLEHHVQLLEQQPYTQVETIILHSDLLLLPSVEEGIANVVLEAMALGTIVLSTDCGGMGEVIQDGFNGFLCPIRDPKAMAKRILDISTLSEDRFKTIIGSAKATISRQHSVEQMVEGMAQLYMEVNNKNRLCFFRS